MRLYCGVCRVGGCLVGVSGTSTFFVFGRSCNIHMYVCTNGDDLFFQDQTTIGGFTRGVSGTSASAPVVAGMLALANAERLALNLPSLGWILPALYSSKDNKTMVGNNIANDITAGRNNCCAGQNIYQLVCCPHGYSAATGWDPISGFGSVNYKRFSAAFGSK